MAKPYTNPITNPNANTNPNDNPKLTLILTLFSCLMLFFEHRLMTFKLAKYKYKKYIIIEKIKNTQKFPRQNSI